MTWSDSKHAARHRATTTYSARERSIQQTTQKGVLHPMVEELATWLNQRDPSTTAVQRGGERPAGRVIAVGSGKGGVGKTLVSSSIALGLAEHFDQRVVAIDVDLGGANLHAGLGIRRPSFALNRFILDSTPLRELSASSGFDRLEFVSGASDIIGVSEFTDADRARFLEELADFREEAIVLDLGAGSSLFNLDLFCTAREGIVVTTPEPTAVQNAYGFLRASIFRRLRLLCQAEGASLRMIEEASNHRGSGEADSVPDLVQRIARFSGSAAAQLEELVGSMRIGLVVNMAKSREAARIAERLAKAVRRYLGARLDFLGSVDFDVSVRRSICEWRPLVVHFPTARATRRLVSLTTKVGSHLDN